MTVNHGDLPNPELHEPKGISSAGDKTVLVADGAGSGSWTAHSSFDDPNIHEPKDISTANLGEVYVADGSSGGAWSSVTAILIEKFTPVDQVITAAGQLVISHGLATAPIIVISQLICQVAELNYSIGDVVQIGYDQDSTTNRGISVTVDSSDLTIRYGSSAASFTLIDKTTGARSGITNASWKLRITAYA